MTTRFITAIGTPLTSDDQLNRMGLEAELADQASAGIHGLLVGGTMGLMQMLADQTYRDLIRLSVELFSGKGEILAGAGDVSFARTRDRILYLNNFKLDGVAVLAPFMLPFKRDELVDYFKALAEVSKAPLYLYDLPQLTRSKLDYGMVLELAKHPNIKGIKCSDEPGYTRQLMDQLDAELPNKNFRIIIAQPDLIDMTIRQGFHDQLDGMWSVAPQWTMQIGRTCDAGKYEQALEPQRDMSYIRRLFMKYGVFPTFTLLLNLRGIPGNFSPKPIRPLSPADEAAIKADPIVQKLVKNQVRQLATA